MNLDLVLTPRRVIVPATEADAERLRIFKPGDLLPVSVRKPRNGDHHRKFMALVAFVAHHHPQYEHVDDVLRLLKYWTHHFDELVLPNGQIIYEMRSISWREMDEGEFREWSAKAREFIFNRMFPELPRERIEQEIDEWLAWA